MPVTLLIQGFNKESICLNIFEAPGMKKLLIFLLSLFYYYNLFSGGENYSDQVKDAFRHCDGVVLFVDVVKGVVLNSNDILKHTK